jgi:hypothetical protein
LWFDGHEANKALTSKLFYFCNAPEESVDIDKVLKELRQERAQLEEAILSIERLAAGRARGRGRPPSWLAAAKASGLPARRRGRPPGSKNKAKPSVTEEPRNHFTVPTAHAQEHFREP